jgi:aminomethyltransferase
VVGDIAGLAPGSGCLSLVTNKNGGIIDDTVITNAGEYVYMVVNGATKFGDMAHFNEQLASFTGDVTMEYLEESMQLLALQGPGAAEAIKKLLPAGFDLVNMAFMTGTEVTLDGIEGCRITRYVCVLLFLCQTWLLLTHSTLLFCVTCITLHYNTHIPFSCGYTGEDGFEIAMPFDHAVSIASKLLSDPSVNPTGLGARDSLRLEAGLCLYGNDLNETITPIEGVLGWTIGARRRTEGGFLGADKLLKPDGKFVAATKKRVGIMGMKAPARDHTEIFDATGTLKIGEITSGTYGPSVKAPVAMGYVDSKSAKAGTEIMLNIRGKMTKAQVTKMPFVEPRYYRVPE